MPGYQYRGNQPDVELAVKDRVTPTAPRPAGTRQAAPAKGPKIVWEEPPVRQHGRASERDLIIEALKFNPGRWARVGEGMKSSSTGTWKKAGCEAVSRRDPSTKLYNVWARWPKATS